MNSSAFTNLTGSFSQNQDETNLEIKKQILESIRNHPVSSKYDQYSFYRYKNDYYPNSYLFYRIKKLIQATTGEWTFFYEITDYGTYLIGVRESKWDEEHFGFKMATIKILSVPDSVSELSIIKKLLVKSIDYLKKRKVRFVITRVNGDYIAALHSLEEIGFRYYDDVIYPIASTDHIPINTEVHLMKPQDIAEVKRIAENFQYQRGHYYCDERFEKKIIDSMYAKWIETSVKNNEPIAVIERNNRIAGFFVFKIDEELLQHTGYKYGSLRLLTLDPNYRGSGVGSELFRGTLSLIKNMGADYIESGYSSKNHISARLHTRASFLSVYEEVTFHLWMDKM
jgi:L-amino acid N-acyltransferase YncA